MSMGWDVAKEQIEEAFTVAEKRMEFPKIHLYLDTDDVIDVWYDDSKTYPSFQYSCSDGEEYADFESLFDDLGEYIFGIGAEVDEIEII